MDRAGRGKGSGIFRGLTFALRPPYSELGAMIKANGGLVVEEEHRDGVFVVVDVTIYPNWLKRTQRGKGDPAQVYSSRFITESLDKGIDSSIAAPDPPNIVSDDAVRNESSKRKRGRPRKSTTARKQPKSEDEETGDDDAEEQNADAVDDNDNNHSPSSPRRARSKQKKKHAKVIRKEASPTSASSPSSRNDEVPQPRMTRQAIKKAAEEAETSDDDESLERRFHAEAEGEDMEDQEQNGGEDNEEGEEQAGKDDNDDEEDEDFQGEEADEEASDAQVHLKNEKSERRRSLKKRPSTPSSARKYTYNNDRDLLVHLYELWTNVGHENNLKVGSKYFFDRHENWPESLRDRNGPALYEHLKTRLLDFWYDLTRYGVPIETVLEDLKATHPHHNPRPSVSKAPLHLASPYREPHVVGDVDADDSLDAGVADARSVNEVHQTEGPTSLSERSRGPGLTAARTPTHQKPAPIPSPKLASFFSFDDDEDEQDGLQPRRLSQRTKRHSRSRLDLPDDDDNGEVSILNLNDDYDDEDRFINRELSKYVTQATDRANSARPNKLRKPAEPEPAAKASADEYTISMIQALVKITGYSYNTALHALYAYGGVYDHALEYLKRHEEPLPDEIAHYWTKNEDTIVTGNPSIDQRRLIDAVGLVRFNQRQTWLQGK